MSDLKQWRKVLDEIEADMPIQGRMYYHAEVMDILRAGESGVRKLAIAAKEMAFCETTGTDDKGGDDCNGCKLITALEEAGYP